MLISVLLSISRKKKKKKNMLEKVNRFPSPPPVDRVEERFQEERKLAQLREMNDKTDLVLQRRRYTNVSSYFSALFLGRLEFCTNTKNFSNPI